MTTKKLNIAIEDTKNNEEVLVLKCSQEKLFNLKDYKEGLDLIELFNQIKVNKTGFEYKEVQYYDIEDLVLSPEFNGQLNLQQKLYMYLTILTDRKY